MQNGPLSFVRPRPGFLQLIPAIDDLLILPLLLMLFDSAKVRTAHKKSEACFIGFETLDVFSSYILQWRQQLPRAGPRFSLSFSLCVCKGEGKEGD